MRSAGVCGLGTKNGAQERTRTFTAVKPLAPEASASTNSATWAHPGRPERARAGRIGRRPSAVNAWIGGAGAGGSPATARWWSECARHDPDDPAVRIHQGDVGAQ